MDPVLRWLLDSDPSIRWQVMRDLTAQSADAIAAERSRIAEEGWGARLLSLQQQDGDWGDGAWIRGSWASTLETLMLLRELGLDPAGARTRRAIGLVRDRSNWGPYHGHSPFFEGEVEPCINGRVLAIGAYFGEASHRLLDRLLSEQLPDGGWNCEAPPSTRSSFNSTLCVLEGLLECERASGNEPTVRDARLRGQEYLLDRRLFKALTSGKVIDRDRKSGRDWRDFSFPTRWRYDILWGLDFLRKSGTPPDERAAEAIDLVIRKRLPDGRWQAAAPHEGKVQFDLEEGHTPSRWVTLRARRVLDWFQGETDHDAP